jgi:hypothetical protein
MTQWFLNPKAIGKDVTPMVEGGWTSHRIRKTPDDHTYEFSTFSL